MLKKYKIVFLIIILFINLINAWSFGLTCILKFYINPRPILFQAHMAMVNHRMLEIDDAKELTEGFLQEELHPKVNLHRPKFAKPKGPPNRGAKRITKVQDLDKQEDS